MTTCKGVVKDNIVVLEDGAQLPDGAEVEVRLLEPSFRRDDVFAQVLANRIYFHYVGNRSNYRGGQTRRRRS